MVNNDDFIKRLENVMLYYQLNASAFADKLAIQRSSISHILSGRNKPSLDFIVKVITEFPEIDFYWLLLGEGVFPKSKTIETSSPPRQVTLDLKHSETSPTEKATPLTSLAVQSSNEKSEEIDRIVFFYKNGSFKEYSNS